MAKFIELHEQSSSNVRLYINVSNIGYVEERKTGAVVQMCCTSFTNGTGSTKSIYVTETYSQIKAKINE